MPKRREERPVRSVAQASSNGLREALLGLLAIRPMSGYDLTRSYIRALQQIWYAPQGQVYPTLRKMHAEGLLVVGIEVQHDRPNRKIYSLTENGRQNLIEWLSRPATLPRMHHEFIHKLFLLNQVDVAKRRDLVKSYAERSHKWCDELRCVEKKLSSALNGEYGESAWYQLLALQHLIRIVECDAKSAQLIAAQLGNRSKVKAGKKSVRKREDRTDTTAFAGFSLSPIQGVVESLTDWDRLQQRQKGSRC